MAIWATYVRDGAGQSWELQALSTASPPAPAGAGGRRRGRAGRQGQYLICHFPDVGHVPWTLGAIDLPATGSEARRRRSYVTSANPVRVKRAVTAAT
jgi:hypothetical protein